jgi:hypothetical protein
MIRENGSQMVLLGLCDRAETVESDTAGVDLEDVEVFAYQKRYYSLVYRNMIFLAWRGRE